MTDEEDKKLEERVTELEFIVNGLDIVPKQQEIITKLRDLDQINHVKLLGSGRTTGNGSYVSLIGIGDNSIYGLTKLRKYLQKNGLKGFNEMAKKDPGHEDETIRVDYIWDADTEYKRVSISVHKPDYNPEWL